MQSLTNPQTALKKHEKTSDLCCRIPQWSDSRTLFQGFTRSFFASLELIKGSLLVVNSSTHFFRVYHFASLLVNAPFLLISSLNKFKWRLFESFAKIHILFRVEKSPVKKIVVLLACLLACVLACVLVCPQGQKNIDSRWLRSNRSENLIKGSRGWWVRIWCQV